MSNTRKVNPKYIISKNFDDIMSNSRRAKPEDKYKVDKNYDDMSRRPGAKIPDMPEDCSKERLEAALENPNEEGLKKLINNYIRLCVVLTENIDDEPLSLKILNYLFAHEQMFELLFVERVDVTNLARQLSEPLKDALADFIITHINEFDRFVRHKTDLIQLNKVFTNNHGIFSQPTVKAAHEAAIEFNKALTK